jgi:hypothetical protein
MDEHTTAPHEAQEGLPLGETPQPQRETKAEAFERMAPPRVERALDAIRLVGNLANRSAYEAQPEDVEAIFATLRQALVDAESRFRSNMPREPFRLRR